MKKSKVVNSLEKIQRGLLFLAPLALFFSYHPSFHIGASETMNFEFSIAELWLLLFSVFSLINLKKLLGFYRKKLFLLFAFPVYAALSVLWSANRTRGLLTAGVLFLLVFAGLNVYYYIKTNKEKLPLLKKLLVFSAVLFSIFCWLQCILDLLGVSRDTTLLCRGCTYLAFGYPHPNGFAIEPQFAGNLLLVPTFIMVYGLITNKPLFKNPWQPLLTIFLVSTVFLTFSRGAIYALLLGLGIIFFARFPVIKYNKKKSNIARTWLIIPITLGSFIFVLGIQGLFAQISPTSDTFWSGVSKSIHQLSLGKIDFRPVDSTTPAGSTNSVDSTIPVDSTSSATPTDPTDSTAQENSSESTFSGYVEESSAFRSQLTLDALDIWNDSPKNLLIGTGLGSAGIKLLEKDPELGIEKEIVQNEYASVLLELGLVGFLLAAAAIIYMLYDAKLNLLLGASLVTLGFTLFFFGGLPNALHVYLFPILLTNPTIERPRRHKK